jgi:hypothetical protein
MYSRAKHELGLIIHPYIVVYQQCCAFVTTPFPGAIGMGMDLQTTVTSCKQELVCAILLSYLPAHTHPGSSKPLDLQNPTAESNAARDAPGLIVNVGIPTKDSPIHV